VADETETPPAAETPAPPIERDILAELSITFQDFVSNNIVYVGYALLLTVLGGAVYGGYESYVNWRLNSEFSALSAIDFKMPTADPLARAGFAPMDDPSDVGRMKDLETGAGLYEKAAQGSHGAAAVTGWLKAAESWHRAGKEDARIAAMEQAITAGGGSELGATAQLQLAAILLDKGDTDKALGLMKAVADGRSDYLGQEGWSSLIRAQMVLGKVDEAKATLAGFHTKFPSANRPELAELGLEVAAAAPAPVEGVAQ